MDSSAQYKIVAAVDVKDFKAEDVNKEELFFIRQDSVPITKNGQVVGWDSVGKLYQLEDTVDLVRDPVTDEPLSDQVKKRIQDRVQAMNEKQQLRRLVSAISQDGFKQAVFKALADQDLIKLMQKKQRAAGDSKLELLEKVALEQMSPMDLPAWQPKLNRQEAEDLLVFSKKTWLLRPSSIQSAVEFLQVDGKTRVPMAWPVVLSVRHVTVSGLAIQHHLLTRLMSIGWVYASKTETLFDAETRAFPTLADLLIKCLGKDLGLFVDKSAIQEAVAGVNEYAERIRKMDVK